MVLIFQTWNLTNWWCFLNMGIVFGDQAFTLFLWRNCCLSLSIAEHIKAMGGFLEFWTLHVQNDTFLQLRDGPRLVLWLDLFKPWSNGKIPTYFPNLIKSDYCSNKKILSLNFVVKWHNRKLNRKPKEEVRLSLKLFNKEPKPYSILPDFLTKRLLACALY